MVQACGKFGAKLIRANEQENSNLFWACRGGGGGNFGIVTSLTFRVHPIKMYQFSQLHGNGKTLLLHFKRGKTWAPYIDERLTSSIELFAKQRNKIEAQGEFVGSPSELHSYYPSS